MTTREMKKTSSFKLSKSEVERIKVMVPTMVELRIIDLMRDYRAIRKAYYGKTIPPVEEVLLRFLPRHEIKRLSGLNEEVDGLCLFGAYRGVPCPYAILLAEDMGTRRIRHTLLHEVAHMKINLKFGRMMGEGKHWNNEMRRLMRLGAFDGWL